MTNAQKIAEWRATHPGELITPRVLLDVLGLRTLRGANLRGANLRDANLWGGLALSTPSGSGYMIPTRDGWRITIGCWTNKTLDDLRALIADETEWPEAAGPERERRRPILAAVLALCEAHSVYHADKLDAVVQKWGNER